MLVFICTRGCGRAEASGVPRALVIGGGTLPCREPGKPELGAATLGHVMPRECECVFAILKGRAPSQMRRSLLERWLFDNPGTLLMEERGTHHPEKWEPVFGWDDAQISIASRTMRPQVARLYGLIVTASSRVAFPMRATPASSKQRQKAGWAHQPIWRHSGARAPLASPESIAPALMSLPLRP